MKKRYHVNMFRVFPLVASLLSIPAFLILIFIYLIKMFPDLDDNILLAASMSIAFAAGGLTLLVITQWVITPVEVELTVDNMIIYVTGISPFYPEIYSIPLYIQGNALLKWDSRTHDQYIVIRTDTGKQLYLIAPKKNREDFDDLYAELCKTN